MCGQPQHDGMLEMFMTPCPLSRYILACVHDHRFAAYDMSFAQLLEKLVTRVKKDETRTNRLAVLHTMLEEICYLILIVHFLRLQLLQPGISQARKDMLQRIILGRDSKYQKLVTSISMTVGNDPSETIKDMDTLKEVIIQIVSIIVRHITNPEHHKTQIVAEIFTFITTNPFYSPS